MFGFGQNRHDRAIAEALATSLDEVRAGTSTIEEALARFPGLAAELEPLLRTGAHLEVLATVEAPEDARLRARYALLAHAARTQASSGVPIRAVRKRAWLAFVPAAAAAVIFALIAVPVMGSIDSGSVPGDWNYGFKRATERVRLALTVDPADRRMLRLEFARRRLDEIERLSSKGVETEAPAVKALIVDYSADLQQVQTSIASSSAAVPDTTAQQLDSIDTRAQQVLAPLAQSAPESAPAVAQDAQTAVTTTHAAATTAQQHTASVRNQHQASPTAAVQPSPTQAPVQPTATSAPEPPTPAPTPAPTATPEPSPAATPTAAPATASATTAPAPPTPVITVAPAPTRAAVVLGTAAPTPAQTPVVAQATARPRATEPPSEETPAAAVTTPSPVPTSISTPFVPAPAPTAIATRTTTVLPVVTPTQAQAPLIQSLVAGDNAFTYTGTAPLTIDNIVASVVGNVVYVVYPNPAGVGATQWFPGGAPVVVLPGTHLTIHMRAAATLVLPR